MAERGQSFAEQLTPAGHRCDEAASALQKSIRRGEEREALFWASELDLAGYGNYVWKRLRIIVSEDVGLASTETVIAVRALYENWAELRKTVKSPYEGFVRVVLLHAVCLLARAPKSRMLDHVLIAMYAGERPQFEVPDYALDRHTARGRRLGRGYEHFVDVGAQLAKGESVSATKRERPARLRGGSVMARVQRASQLPRRTARRGRRQRAETRKGPETCAAARLEPPRDESTPTSEPGGVAAAGYPG
jgi:replication-associated recombination protein RarA